MRRRLAVGTTLMLTAGVLLALTTESLLANRDAQQHPAPGDHVHLHDGRRLHVQVSGVGKPGPTVVFEAGAGSFSSQWAWVQRRVAAFAPTVSYDRPGLGWSDPYPSSWDGSMVAADLRAALQQLGLPEPYVLVGHSLGATYARVFAHDHPGSVAALVLVDPGHEDQFQVMPGADDLTGLRLMHIASRLGLLRLTRPFDDLGATMPADVFAAWTTRSYSADNTRGFLEEGKAATRRIAPQVQRMDTDLGTRPLTVLRAADAEWPDVAAMRALQGQLADLSRESEVIDVTGADHYSIVADPEHAETVAREISQAVQQVR